MNYTLRTDFPKRCWVFGTYFARGRNNFIRLGIASFGAINSIAPASMSSPSDAVSFEGTHANTAPGTAPRGRLGDSAMDEGSPSSANSDASVASKHHTAAKGSYEFRVEYTPESKPLTLTSRRTADIAPSGGAGWSSAAGWLEVDGGSVAVAARAWARALGDGAWSLVVGVIVAVTVTLAMVAAQQLWTLCGTPGGTWGAVSAFSMRMGGMPPRARPSWREGFILV